MSKERCEMIKSVLCGLIIRLKSWKSRRAIKIDKKKLQKIGDNYGVKITGTW